ncbi:hypothetical protein [Puniceicoccus vermicola]|uniref:Uncharacterized protein n=1 Tax=Puniceicoccus vermicola TaxID=388746 RepID=A0A7X1AZM2_9BACT|nr:hypothetical protein [Puniceicoccus vermicola]MBC2602911.1 hypothetical protein [Puniceicoccus vermicola]
MKNKTKALISLIITIIVSQAAANTEAGTFTLASGSLVQSGNDHLQVDEGFKATILGYSLRTGDDVSGIHLERSHITIELLQENTEITLIDGVGIVENMTFIGPLSIRTRALGNNLSLATTTIKVERATLPSEFVPNNSVVIPSDLSVMCPDKNGHGILLEGESKNEEAPLHCRVQKRGSQDDHN